MNRCEVYAVFFFKTIKERVRFEELIKENKLDIPLKVKQMEITEDFDSFKDLLTVTFMIEDGFLIHEIIHFMYCISQFKIKSCMVRYFEPAISLFGTYKLESKNKKKVFHEYLSPTSEIWDDPSMKKCIDIFSKKNKNDKKDIINEVISL